MMHYLRRFQPQSVGLKHIITDLALMSLSLYLSLFLRTGFSNLDQHLHALEAWTAIFLATRLLCYIGFGVYQCMWRYVSVPDAIRLGEATLFFNPADDRVDVLLSRLRHPPPLVLYYRCLCLSCGSDQRSSREAAGL